MGGFRGKVLDVVIGAALVLSVSPLLPAQESNPAATTREQGGRAEEVPHLEKGALVQAALLSRVNWGRLRQGSELEGRLSLPLFSGAQLAVPAGSIVRLTIESSEKVREKLGVWAATGHAIVRAFNPLEKSRAPEYRVALRAAELVLQEGNLVPLHVIVLRAGSGVLVQPRKAKDADASQAIPEPDAASRNQVKAASVVVLELADRVDLPSRDAASTPEPSAPQAVRASAFLLNPLSASQSREGDRFQASLAEPLKIGDRVFEAGSLLEGTVVRRTPPRMLSRAGTLYVRFDRLAPKGGEAIRVAGNLAQAEADSQTRFVLDEEGLMRGRKPGLKSRLVDLGIAYTLGKVTDDISEAPIRAIGASMSDAAVANAARYVGLASSVAFLVTRRGRDVYLPKYSQIQIELGRPDGVPTSPTSAPAADPK